MRGLNQRTTRFLQPIRKDGLLRWIARLAAKRSAGVLLAAYVFSTDWPIGWHDLSFTPRGVIDEPAHLATALVVLGAITRFRRSPPEPKFGWTMLACSVLIDLDHLPAEFGSTALTKGTPRPYTHALWTVIILALAWAIARYLTIRTGRSRSATAELILAGAAWGVAVHFVRDIATAPMSFWWPVTAAAVQVPYWWYAVALLAIIALPPVRRPKGAVENSPSGDTIVLPESVGSRRPELRDQGRRGFLFPPSFYFPLAETELPANATLETDVPIVRPGRGRGDLGIKEQAEADATAHELIGDTVFRTSIAGEEIDRIRTWRTHPAREADYQLITKIGQFLSSKLVSVSPNLARMLQAGAGPTAHQPRERCRPTASRTRRPEVPVTGPPTWLKRRGTYTPVCRGRVPIRQRRFEHAKHAQGDVHGDLPREQPMCARLPQWTSPAIRLGRH